MDTIDTLRMFCDGRMSMHDIRALMLSMGHSLPDFVSAVEVLTAEPDHSIRFGAYERDEYYAEMYLTAGKG